MTTFEREMKFQRKQEVILEVVDLRGGECRMLSRSLRPYRTLLFRRGNKGLGFRRAFMCRYATVKYRMIPHSSKGALGYAAHVEHCSHCRRRRHHDRRISFRFPQLQK